MTNAGGDGDITHCRTTTGRCSLPQPPLHPVMRERCTAARKDADNYCGIPARNNLEAGRSDGMER